MTQGESKQIEILMTAMEAQATAIGALGRQNAALVEVQQELGSILKDTGDAFAGINSLCMALVANLDAAGLVPREHVANTIAGFIEGRPASARFLRPLEMARRGEEKPSAVFTVIQGGLSDASAGRDAE